MGGLLRSSIILLFMIALVWCLLYESCFVLLKLEFNVFANFLQEPTRPAIPILLAVGAVHQHLIENGLRMSASIVADTAQCFSTHQFACLIGYGARLLCKTF